MLLLLCTTDPEAARARAQLQLRSQTPFLSFLFFSSFLFLAKASLWSFCVNIKFKSQRNKLAFKRVFMRTSHSSLQTLCTAEKAEVKEGNLALITHRKPFPSIPIITNFSQVKMIILEEWVLVGRDVLRKLILETHHSCH